MMKAKNELFVYDTIVRGEESTFFFISNIRILINVYILSKKYAFIWLERLGMFISWKDAMNDSR